MLHMGLPGDSAGKNTLAMQESQETWVRSLGWEDLLEEGILDFLPGEFPWTEKPSGLQSMRSQTAGHD